MLPLVYFLAGTLGGLGFLLDTQTSLGMAPGVPYIFIVLLGLWAPDRRMIWWGAFFGSVLTVIGFFAAAPGGTAGQALTNRALTLCMIWGAAALCTHYRKGQEIRVHKNDLLERVLNLLPLPAFIRDREGRLRWANRPAVEHLGFPPKMLSAGVPPHRLPQLQPTDPEFEENLDLLRTWKTKTLSPKVFTDSLGREHAFLPCKFPIHIQGNGDQGILELLQDASREQRLADEVARLDKTLEKRVEDSRRELQKSHDELQEKHRFQEELFAKTQKSETRFRSLAQSSPIGLFELNEEACYSFVNHAWEKIAGQSFRNVLGRPWDSFFVKGDRQRIKDKWDWADKEEKEFCGELRIERPDGKLVWVSMRSTFFYNDTGKTILGTLADISLAKHEEAQREEMIQELMTLKQKLEKTARTDPLTDLSNRRDMNDKLRIERSRSERHNLAFTILIADIDHFKKVNDTHGHDAGDAVLVTVSQVLKTSVRAHDMVARWGGEEFLILLPGTGPEGAAVVGEKIRSQVEATLFRHQGQTLKVTMSFGGSAHHPGKILETCIKEADDALYEAKRSGRNRVNIIQDCSQPKSPVIKLQKKKN